MAFLFGKEHIKLIFTKNLNMKRLGYILSLFVLLCAFTCENEPLEGEFVNEEANNSCADAIQDVAEAALAFVGADEANYSELCNAYVNALTDQINACGDDGTIQGLIDQLGDCTQDQPTGIEGIWLLTAWNGTEPIDLNNDGTESTNFLEELDCYNNETIVFNADNTGQIFSTSYAEIDIVLEVGSTNSYDFTVDCIEAAETTDMTWSQNGNVVSITDVSGTSDWTLNGNMLSITIPEGFVVISSEDATVTVIQDLTFIYTKQ